MITQKGNFQSLVIAGHIGESFNIVLSILRIWLNFSECIEKRVTWIYIECNQII